MDALIPLPNYIATGTINKNKLKASSMNEKEAYDCIHYAQTIAFTRRKRWKL